MAVEFHDFSIEVTEALEGAAIRWLHEAISTLQTQAEDNTPRDTGWLMQHWNHVVDESKLEATVGNTEENAIWTEMGTGEYALKGNGRRGGWYILIGEGSGQISQATVDKYHMKVKYGKDGKKYAFTYGKKPVRMLHNAFVTKKARIIRRAEEIFGGLG